MEHMEHQVSTEPSVWFANHPICLIACACIAETASLFFVIRLLRGRDSVARKCLWTAILLIPVLGLVAYGALYEIPSVQAEVDRAGGSGVNYTP